MTVTNAAQLEILSHTTVIYKDARQQISDSASVAEHILRLPGQDESLISEDQHCAVQDACVLHYK